MYRCVGLKCTIEYSQLPSQTPAALTFQVRRKMLLVTRATALAAVISSSGGSSGSDDQVFWMQALERQPTNRTASSMIGTALTCPNDPP